MTPPKSPGNFVLLLAGAMPPGMDISDVAATLSGVLSSVTITLPMSGALKASMANLTSEEPAACVKRLAALVTPLVPPTPKLVQ